METEWKKKIPPPSGIYWLSILVFLNFGVYQFIGDFNAMRSNESETPLLIAVILISLDVFSTGAAIWALFGDNSGRIALLAFISLNFLWSIFTLIIVLSYSTIDANIFLFGLSLLKPLLIFGICWWYFTRKDVVAYYKQNG